MAAKDLFDLIDEFCTGDQVREVLRSYKKDSPRGSILIGSSKAEAVRQLRTAIDARHIPIDEAHNLLREGEENGSQHILYYRPKTKAYTKLCQDFEEIGKHLFGSDWPDSVQFPRLTAGDDRWEWADFRPGKKKKPRDWVAKLYCVEKSEKLNKIEQRPDGGSIHYYDPVETRVVGVLRWNDPDILELRLPICESRRLVEKRRAALKLCLGDLLDNDKVTPWDLATVRKCLLEKRADNANLYKISSLRLADSGSGLIDFHPYTEDEEIDEAKERREAIDLLLGSEECVCPNAVATWLFGSGNNGQEQELRSVIGVWYPNQLVIRGQTSSEAVDHVTDQLRRFDR